MIYHIVPASELHACLKSDLYQPPSLADCGFVHCALESSVIPVANDFFAATSEKLLLLEIDPEKLTPVVRYEPAAPAAEGQASHLAGGSQFPHVYGPIDEGAITAVGVLERGRDGYQWPEVLVPLESFSEFPPPR